MNWRWWYYTGTHAEIELLELAHGSAGQSMRSGRPRSAGGEPTPTTRPLTAAAAPVARIVSHGWYNSVSSITILVHLHAEAFGDTTDAENVYMAQQWLASAGARCPQLEL